MSNGNISKILSVSINIVNKTPVTNIGHSANVTYKDSTIDLSAVSGLFTLGAGVGASVYTLETGGTGEGNLTRSTLAVTKAGTFTIGLITAATSTHDAGMLVTAALMVNLPLILIWSLAKMVQIGKHQTN